MSCRPFPVDRSAGGRPDLSSGHGQHHILAAEAEAIDERPAHRDRTPLPGYEIQLAIRIRLGQVQRGRDKLVRQGQRGADDLESPTRGKGMAQRSLEGTDRNPAGMRTQGLLQR